MIAPRWARLSAVVLACLMALPGCGRDEPAAGLPRGVLTITGSGPEVRVEVEIAETDRTRARGLMHRRALASDAGMVFLEEEPSTSGFWMKDTLIPLSIAFWSEDGRIFRILDMEPCRQLDCPSYSPEGEWVGALEVNQGFFREHGVEVGDRVRLERS